MKKVLFVLVLFTLFVAQVQAQGKAVCEIRWKYLDYIGNNQYRFTYSFEKDDGQYFNGRFVFNDITKKMSQIRNDIDEYDHYYSSQSGTIAGLPWSSPMGTHESKISIYSNDVVTQIIDLGANYVEDFQWTADEKGFIVEQQDDPAADGTIKQTFYYVGLDNTKVTLLKKNDEESVEFATTKDGTFYYVYQTDEDVAAGKATIYRLDTNYSSQVVAIINSPLEPRLYVWMNINPTGKIFELRPNDDFRVFYDTRSMKTYAYQHVMGGNWIGDTWGYYRDVKNGDVNETEQLHTVDFTDPNNILEVDYLLKGSNWWFKWIDQDHIMSLTDDPQIINIKTDERRSILDGLCPLG